MCMHLYSFFPFLKAKSKQFQILSCPPIIWAEEARSKYYKSGRKSLYTEAKFVFFTMKGKQKILWPMSQQPCKQNLSVRQPWPCLCWWGSLLFTTTRLNTAIEVEQWKIRGSTGGGSGGAKWRALGCSSANLIFLWMCEVSMEWCGWPGWCDHPCPASGQRSYLGAW